MEAKGVEGLEARALGAVEGCVKLAGDLQIRDEEKNVMEDSEETRAIFTICQCGLLILDSSSRLREIGHAAAAVGFVVRFSDARLPNGCQMCRKARDPTHRLI
jgi:hypothetical protein